MRRKPIVIISILTTGLFLLLACNNEKESKETKEVTNDKPVVSTDQPEVHGTETKPGEIKYETPLNTAWVTNGKSITELKCQSCHKLTEERLVGPGWKGVTKRREPEWIMNMITNVEMMLESDPEAQKLLEQCLVRMPNQNVSTDDARQIIEFMRSNDGEK